MTASASGSWPAPPPRPRPSSRRWPRRARDAGDGSFAALHGLYWLTANLAEDGRLLLVVDDLHWCDAPSLRYLGFVARRLAGSGIVLALGLRSGEPGIDPVLVAELASDATRSASCRGP